MSLLLALLMTSTAPAADGQLLRLTKLYADICLNSFPDDKALEAMMVARGARELSKSDVKVTMLDDPARAWDLNDGGATLWIEYPPFHACSVRWSAPDIGNMDAYRALAKTYEGATFTFTPSARRAHFRTRRLNPCSSSIRGSPIQNDVQQVKRASRSGSSTSMRRPNPRPRTDTPYVVRAFPPLRMPQ
jgi:hypothetical protein